MVLSASGEGATSSHNDWHWEWTLEVILFSLPPQAESLKAGCLGPGQSLVSLRMGIIIEGISRFTKAALNKQRNKKPPTKLSTFHLQGITWVIAVIQIFATGKIQGIFSSVNLLEVNTTSQVLLILFNTT